MNINFCVNIISILTHSKSRRQNHLFQTVSVYFARLITYAFYPAWLCTSCDLHPHSLRSYSRHRRCLSQSKWQSARFWLASGVGPRRWRAKIRLLFVAIRSTTVFESGLDSASDLIRANCRSDSVSSLIGGNCRSDYSRQRSNFGSLTPQARDVDELKFNRFWSKSEHDPIEL